VTEPTSTRAPARLEVLDLEKARRARERQQLAALGRALSEKLRQAEWKLFRRRYAVCPMCGRKT
jgi:hypothetical protein